MIEFFALQHIMILLITVLLTVCVFTQTLTAAVSYYRYPRSKARVFENLLELFILGQIMICTLLHIQAEEEFRQGILTAPDYVYERIFFFTVVVTLVFIVTGFSKKLRMLPVIAAAGATLPFIEDLAGHGFVYVNGLAIVFLMARSIAFGLLYYKENKNALSALSVKNAIDSMTTGVMFCERDGFVLLVNKRMHRLMVAITGKIQRNGRHFFGLLTLGEIEPGCRVTWFEDQNVCLLPDGSAWLFGITDVQIKKKTYAQITATDITERWKLTGSSRHQNEELSRRQDELSEAIANLHIVSREKETQKAKMRAHNILGERLTALQRIIRNENAPDYAMLRNQSQELMDELKSSGNTISPQDEIEVLIQTFASIGVEVKADENLTKDSGDEQKIVKMVREAVTNAVRNSFATKVSVSLDTKDAQNLLKITHNGF